MRGVTTVKVVGLWVDHRIFRSNPLTIGFIPRKASGLSNEVNR